MSTNLGPGVSRVLDPTGTEFVEVIWQQGRPPLDSELNLLQELASGFARRLTLRGTPSGWLGNETNTSDVYLTDPSWSNWFKFGRQKASEQKAVQWAVVNGWVIPVAGTRTGTPPGLPNNTDLWNKIALDPPPANSGDFRVDFVFLEAWQARVPPNPSVLNKPSASAIYRYGNVEGGFSFITDDITDPNIGQETTQRVQVQYRIRVVKGLLGFASYPDGFDPTVVFAQGGVSAPTAYTFANMRQALGDPGLWRAGDGSGTAQTALGTVDGYVYAIPICAVFRRNGVVWLGDPSPNLNGSFNRNPLAVDRSGATTFSGVATLAADLTAAGLSATLTAAANLPLPLLPATPVLIQIGEEVMTYSAISGTTMTLVTRGANSSRAEVHKAGATIRVLSGRADGLFADQVAKTDILDLRHVVNPNGFDYQALLDTNISKLLKGQLRANWKRTGAGPQGPFCLYQDKIVPLAGSVSLGVTRLDGPDNIRTVFSDAAVMQKIDLVIKPGPVVGAQPVGVAWSLNLNVDTTVQTVANQFNPGDAVKVYINQFKAGLPGGDADQVRFINDSLSGAVTIRIDGQMSPLDPSVYTVTPASPGPTDDLTITFGGSFPAATAQQLYITILVQYGPGRGVARRPDSFHSAAFLSTTTDTLKRPTGNPYQYQPMHMAWMPVWSKFLNTTYKGSLPVTAECYVDLGSKSVAVTPFRRIELPTEFRAVDGTGANVNSSYTGGSAGDTFGTIVFQDAGVNFTALGAVVGDVLTITSGPAAGQYMVVTVAPGGDNTKIEVNVTLSASTGETWTLSHVQGLMPLLSKTGAAKWTTTDPLEVFSGTTDGTASRKNIFVVFPRNLVPGWGEVHVPILWQDTSPFAEGVNYMSLSVKGAGPFSPSDQNYVPYQFGAASYAKFSTWDGGIPGTAPYNTAFIEGGHNFAGIQKFTDTLGYGREGLQLPPFYGIARLFAVYEHDDYITNGSAYNATTRAATGAGATNLLKQNVDGPTFWIEQDSDGDGTFILNAACIDISRSPNPIANFASGEYVIEASIFGFDRNAFSLNDSCRIVLTRERLATQANDPIRSNNTSPTGTVNVISGPVAILPGPLMSSDAVVLTYSRTPYQGDAWGSQTSYIDIGQFVGPLTSGTAYQLSHTSLNFNALTRPNQKVLEVLAVTSFATTLGTGRISGIAKKAPTYDVRTVGYEEPTGFPPTSPVASRPKVLSSGFTNDMELEVGTEFLGCTERLPLGALFRDKDFTGGNIDSNSYGSFLWLNGANRSDGLCLSLPMSSDMEQTEAPANTATYQGCYPGEMVVHVDGEQANYALLVNYRTFRGGSAFGASGPYPGGEVLNLMPFMKPPATGHVNLLGATVLLVRNTVTNVGATEVSAGDELMMLVITTSRKKFSQTEAFFVGVGTQGTGEGLCAADLYRIEGHPLANDHVREDIDPSLIRLTRRFL